VQSCPPDVQLLMFVVVVGSALLIADWLGVAVDWRCLPRFVLITIVSGEIFLRIEVCAADDAIELVGVIHDGLVTRVVHAERSSKRAVAFLSLGRN